MSKEAAVSRSLVHHTFDGRGRNFRSHIFHQVDIVGKCLFRNIRQMDIRRIGKIKFIPIMLH